MAKLKRKHLEPIDAGHHHIDDDGVERQGLGEIEAFLAGRGQAHAIALALQQRAKNVPHDFFVVDDEYCSVSTHYTPALWRCEETTVEWGVATKRSSNRVPFPGVLSH